MNVDAAIDTLREKAGQANELQRLRDRVEELEELLGVHGEDKIDPLVSLALTPMERRVLGVIYRWELVRRPKLYTLLYGARPECDQPAIKLLDVWVSKVRRYLTPFGIMIDHQDGAGWFMTEENKAKLAALAVRLRTEAAE